jgi:lipooligosaccharide transport system permease protein
VYDGMLSAPISVRDLILGEILWAGSKGFFFAFAVLVIVIAFGLVPLPGGFFAPLIGFLTGLMFASLSLFITSYVKNINHFNFYFTGLLSPMFFFSGVVFPVENLPAFLRPVSEILPLTHAVRLVRRLAELQLDQWVLIDIGYVVAFTGIFGTLAISRLRGRLVD